jgi:hypothetical protein
MPLPKGQKNGKKYICLQAYGARHFGICTVVSFKRCNRLFIFSNKAPGWGVIPLSAGNKWFMGSDFTTPSFYGGPHQGSCRVDENKKSHPGG